MHASAGPDDALASYVRNATGAPGAAQGMMATVPPYLVQVSPYVPVEGFGPLDAERELRHVEGLLISAWGLCCGEPNQSVMRSLWHQHAQALLDIGHGNRTG